MTGVQLGRALRQRRIATRRMTACFVRRLPPAVADRLRGPVTAPPKSRRHRVHAALLEVLRLGGIPAGVATFALRDNPRLVFVNAESLVLHRLYWFGEQGWEPELLHWWRRSCRQASAVLELGANVGYFTVQGAKAGPQARYTAVEPYPASARVCKANLELNSVESVELVEAAAVAHSRGPAIELHVPTDQLALPTVAFIDADTELPEDMGGHDTKRVPVPTVDVRSLLSGTDLVKLDIEGQEHSLLAASIDHLRTRKPTVFVEMLPGTARLRQLIAGLCREDGFHCYVPRADSLVRLDTPDILGAPLLDRYGGQDVILSPDPRMDRRRDEYRRE